MRGYEIDFDDIAYVKVEVHMLQKVHSIIFKAQGENHDSELIISFCAIKYPIRTVVKMTI